jgi:biopolymer transport protein ExbD
MPSIAGLDSGVNSEINMVPMIDIMLVLLIIFMVITPALAGYSVVLPKALTAEQESDDRVTLGIDIEGRFYLDDRPQPIAQAELLTTLVSLYETRPDDHVLYLKADAGVDYSVVLTAIDAARGAGVRRIGAITEMATPPGEGS